MDSSLEPDPDDFVLALAPLGGSQGVAPGDSGVLKSMVVDSVL